MRSLTAKIIGRWETPIPKRHRFVSSRDERPESYWNAIPSLLSFAVAKATGHYRPGMPWLPYSAIRWLDNVLTPMMSVLEIGAGASTVFFARRARRVVSVEQDPEWRRRVEGMDTGAEIRSTIPAASFDLILLDAEPREAVFDRLREQLLPGGYLVVDNWDWPRYNLIRQRITPTYTFTDFAPYNFSVSTLAVFYRPR